jgi:hypothetical protein
MAQVRRSHPCGTYCQAARFVPKGVTLLVTDRPTRTIQGRSTSTSYPPRVSSGERRSSASAMHFLLVPSPLPPTHIGMRRPTRRKRRAATHQHQQHLWLPNRQKQPKPHQPPLAV